MPEKQIFKVREQSYGRIEEVEVSAVDPTDAAQTWASDLDCEWQKDLWDSNGVVALVVDEQGNETRVRCSAYQSIFTEVIDK